MSPRETIEKQKQKANSHSRGQAATSLDTSGEGNFVRSNDALDGRLQLSAASRHAPDKAATPKETRNTERERKCSGWRTMDSRLFADTRRSCLFIHIDFSALRAMKSCLVRSRL